MHSDEVLPPKPTFTSPLYSLEYNNYSQTLRTARSLWGHGVRIKKDANFNTGEEVKKGVVIYEVFPGELHTTLGFGATFQEAMVDALKNKGVL